LLVNISFAQIAYNDTAKKEFKPFYEYLLSQHRYNDACTLLKDTRNNQPQHNQHDSITTSIAMLYLSLDYCDSSNRYFKQIDSFHNSLIITTAIETAFSQNDTLAIVRYLQAYKSSIDDSTYTTYKLSLSMLRHQPIDSSFLSTDSSALKNIAKRYYSFEPKSPLVAGLLSAIIPGWGKRYLGYKKLAKGAFYTNLFLAGIATEVLLRTAKPFPIIASVAAFGTFYVGNIWGTVLLARKRERDFYNQIGSDIGELYYDKLSVLNKKTALITDANVQLKNSLLEIEYLNWKTLQTQKKCELILSKSQSLKQSGYFVEAYEELQRLDTIQSANQTAIVYEKALDAYVLKDYNQCYNILLELPDSIRMHQKATTRLWLLTLIENKKWEQCKNEMQRLSDSSNPIALQVHNLPTTIAYKSPITAQRLSTYFPGLGLFYAHKPLKAITSIIIESTCIAITASLIVSAYYFTPLIVGIYPCFRFYQGGRELSYAKTVEWNNLRIDECKQAYQDLVFRVVK
jgi:hypothetical protein